MEDAVYDVATAAYDQLLTARSLLAQIPDAAFPALLSAVSIIFSQFKFFIIN
jgi:NADH dehydrogenase [ubiquinone] 1 alpha subcomplex assembly factor 6